MKKIPNSLKK